MNQDGAPVRIVGDCTSKGSLSRGWVVNRAITGDNGQSGGGEISSRWCSALTRPIWEMDEQFAGTLYWRMVEKVEEMMRRIYILIKSEFEF